MKKTIILFLFTLIYSCSSNDRDVDAVNNVTEIIQETKPKRLIKELTWDFEIVYKYNSQNLISEIDYYNINDRTKLDYKREYIYDGNILTKIKYTMVQYNYVVFEYNFFYENGILKNFEHLYSNYTQREYATITYIDSSTKKIDEISYYDNLQSTPFAKEKYVYDNNVISTEFRVDFGNEKYVPYNKFVYTQDDKIGAYSDFYVYTLSSPLFLENHNITKIQKYNFSYDSNYNVTSTNLLSTENYKFSYEGDYPKSQYNGTSQSVYFWENKP